MTKNIRIGSRGSLLALNQANLIKVIIEKGEPDLRAEIIIIKTTGDKILDVPLAKVGGKGLFVKEIEDALIDNRIDIAVHSMKDVPFLIPDQLIIQAITKREDPRDILISKEGLKIDELPKGARIGTSSLRRQAQLLHHRPDLQISQLRGNLDTRIKKAFTPEFDAVILAAAGLHRMGWEEKITEYIDESISIPAVGQGALGIEIRHEDRAARKIADSLNDRETSIAVRAERSFMKRLEGGCQVPIGAIGKVEGGKITLTGFIADVDGKRMVKASDSDHIDRCQELGVRLAEKLLNMGGKSILVDIFG